MKNLNISDEHPDAIVQKFYSLAEDLEYNVPTDESAAKYISEMWNNNVDLATSSFITIFCPF
ncbi:hypothetical protein FACS189454_01430 [Planctomycetales bacterium]|nr:hypothetical protein FACS189454_01430 [Planctomycetales bacterium]